MEKRAKKNFERLSTPISHQDVLNRICMLTKCHILATRLEDCFPDLSLASVHNMSEKLNYKTLIRRECFFFKFSSFVHVQKQLQVSGFLSRFLRSQLPTSCKHFCKSYSSCSKAVPNMTPSTHCPKWEKREVSCLQLQPLPKLPSCSV